LLGNHDVQYLEARRDCLRHRVPRHLQYRCGSAFKASAAAKITKNLPLEFWQATRLFVVVDGWLLSHAGLTAAHWPVASTIESSLLFLSREERTALQFPAVSPHPLLAPGRCRGGDADVGGITWLDWDE